MRWDNLELERERQPHLPGADPDPVVRTFDAPEALDTRFHEIHARSVLNRVPAASRMPFRWTINPYRGCSHSCGFCFARPTHTYLGFNAREDFEREIVVKVNAPEVLRAELRRPSWQREHVAMGTNTDPYQWVESKYRLMPEIWRALADAGTPCSVLTKSPLLLSDLDVLKEISEKVEVSANFSVPTIDRKVWRETEPRTPNPYARLEAVKTLNDAGIPTGILIAPLMPGVNDQPEQVAKIVELATEAGATGIGGIGLHLRGEVREIWMDWLHEHRPDLIDRYERLYSRGAYLPQQERDRLAALARPRGGPRPPRMRGRQLPMSPPRGSAPHHAPPPPRQEQLF